MYGEWWNIMQENEINCARCAANCFGVRFHLHFLSVLSFILYFARLRRRRQQGQPLSFIIAFYRSHKRRGNSGYQRAVQPGSTREVSAPRNDDG